jgi:glycosyltransferase involved in cell wall biosynthesis
MLYRKPVYVKLAAGGRGGDLAGFPMLPGWLRAFGVRRASRVQAISDEIRDELLALGLPPERVVAIPNGIDTTRFFPSTPSEKAQARARLGIPADENVVLFVGRFHRVKGIVELLQVWNDPALAPDARLLLVGGTEWSQLRGTFEPSERIDVREWTPAIEDCYRAADVFVLPSYTEGMSNALLESMACAVPAVATRVGAAESMVTDGESALLIEPRDAPSLSAALRALVNDPALRARVGAAAHERVQAYSISSVVARIAAQYEQLLST